MISFTDLDLPAPAKHLQKFGRFGIVVSQEWARLNMAQPVFYVPDEGLITTTLRSLFTIGYEQVQAAIQGPDDAAARMAFTNKVMAEVQGCLLWNNLLTLYEYLEPADHADQSEWRIVHPHPLYGYPPSTQEIIQRVSPPKNWSKQLNVLRVPSDEVTGFVCPRQDEQSFARTLPAGFSFQANPVT